MPSDDRDRRSHTSSRDKPDRRDKSDRKDKKDKKDKRERSRHHSSRRRYDSDSDSSSSSDSDYDRKSRKRSKKPSIDIAPTVSLPSAIFGYSNESNPFNDENISKPFVWKKKLEKMSEEGQELPSFSEQALRAKMEAQRQEIENVKRRREERIKELEEMRLLKEQMQRDLEIEANLEFDQKEVEFHRLQAWKRAQIRIQDGRSRPVDELMKFLFVQLKLTDPERLRQLGMALGESEREIRARDEFLATLDVDIEDPSVVMGRLTTTQLLELRQDIDELRSLCGPAGGADQNKGEREFWSCAAAICARYQDIAAVRHTTPSATTPGAAMDVAEADMAVATKTRAVCATGSGLGRDVVVGVHAMLGSRSFKELMVMERDVARRAKQEEEAAPHASFDALLPVPQSGNAPFPGSTTLSGNPMEEPMDTSRIWLGPPADYQPFPLTLAPPPAAHAHTRPSYWRAVHNELIVFAARAKMRAFALRLLKMKLLELARLKREEERAARLQLLALRDNTTSTASVSSSSAGSSSTSGPTSTSTSAPAKVVVVPDVDLPPPPPPTLLPPEAVPPGARVLPQTQADAILRAHRHAATHSDAETAVEAIFETWRTPLPPTTAAAAATDIETDPEAAALRRAACGALEEGEEYLQEAALQETFAYKWQDRYRPRKPRYINKVKTGFAWHKYNQAHYDKDNPPPKVVQGYKFNIFYPDLIEPHIAPRFTLSPDPDGNIDYCILRFSAGAPYEDIAFKIVNKKWTLEKKHGYKCVFHKGVLSLWFNFQRVGYRR